MVAIWSGGSPEPGNGPRRSETPYASSMAGTAMPAMRLSGSLISGGSGTARTDSSSPSTEPTVSGLRTIRVDDNPRSTPAGAESSARAVSQIQHE